MIEPGARTHHAFVALGGGHAGLYETAIQPKAAVARGAATKKLLSLFEMPWLRVAQQLAHNLVGQTLPVTRIGAVCEFWTD